MRQDWPFTRDLLLIGGGHTHAIVLKRWGMTPLPGTRVTVINPEPTAPYSGMLPGHLAGHYSRDALDIDLVRLARFAGARLLIDRATGLDPIARAVTLASGRRIDFDTASIDIGITSEMPQLPGFAQYAVPAKPLGRFASAWRAYLDQTGPAQVAVIGGGVAGAEIAMAFAHAMRARGRPAQVHIVESGRVLAALPERAAQRLRSALETQRVTLHEHTNVTEVTAEGLHTDKGAIPARFVCGATGARPQDWLQNSDLALHEGFVEVGPTLETSTPGIFAVGDCAHMVSTPRPKAGVYAVRQAPVLYDNLRASLAGRSPRRRYVPQSNYLKLISLGEKAALGDRFGWSFSGGWVWRCKDRIDQTFMKKFSDLPAMERPAAPKEHAEGLDDLLRGKPLCGGCGAKVGQPALIAALQAGSGDAMPGDDAAVVSIDGAQLVLSTDHLRESLLDPIAMTEIAAHHALGDIWAMGGRPKAATANLVIRQASGRIATRILREIMEAGRAVMEDAGAEIVGGHSSQGAETTIGFTVLGRCDRAPITLKGARPGDRLILTKPIGSGLIMAAEMMGQAQGAWVAQALRLMTVSQRRASEILSGAHAMTDVTGFGLLGHLHNICMNSGSGAELWLDAVPVMTGAHALAESGLRASLHGENRLVMPELPQDARHDLLFDPQTAGGLLAAVPPGDTLQRLIDAGYPAAEIGEVTGQPGYLRVV
ncbi:selenide, water dikinase SelD [Sagittula salina]|uniref:Selenide, water dikinase SelD n=1 Tax=Sagittula salina TaxID=2820268 RepID=A0A940MQV3_9RHOB|nr:selenide, water dikinase SelD [Sagittula salina]MBP0481394.1 selenide, water dikinase SelD [Sagittula salina]